jgi:hypothetical protein
VDGDLQGFHVRAVRITVLDAGRRMVKSVQAG